MSYKLWHQCGTRLIRADLARASTQRVQNESHKYVPTQDRTLNSLPSQI